MAEDALTVPQQLRDQAEWSRRLESPLYAHLLTRAAEDYEAGGRSGSCSSRMGIIAMESRFRCN